MKAPSAVGSVVSRNFPAGSMPNTGSGRNSTSTDHRLQTEKPMCSEKTEKNRWRRATRLPVRSQKAGSSGRQSSIQRDLPGGAGGAAVVGAGGGGGGGAGRGGGAEGCGHAGTVAGAGSPAVAPRENPCSVSLTGAAPVW